MFHDDEIDEVFLEFRRLSRRLGGSSTPIIRDMIRSIKRATNEIRRNHWREEDGPQDRVADETHGERFGDRQSRGNNSLLGHEVLPVGLTVPGHMRAGLDSTPRAPVDDDELYRIDERYAVGEAIATHMTDKEDNRLLQNQNLSSVSGRERGSGQEAGERMNVDYEAGPADTETLESGGTSQFGRKGDPTCTGLHRDGADLEHNRVQQNLPSSRGRDKERAQDRTQNRTQDQAQEPKLRRSSRIRKQPTEDDGHGSESDHEVRLARQAALRARTSSSRQSAPFPQHKRRKHTKDKPNGVDDLYQFESQLGNEATLIALREANMNWPPISQSGMATDDGPEDGASDGLSFMISLGRRLSMSPAEAWASRILHRIRCTHFHQLYIAAIEDTRKGHESSFFRMSDELLRRHGVAPTRRYGNGFGVSSAVKDRLVELILLDPRLRIQLSKDRCRQIIQDIEQNGKRWSRPIQRLGYEILLLIPDELSDRRMKLLTDGQRDWLISGWKTRFVRLNEAEREEVQQTLDVMFMPHIKPYLEIYSAGGGFSSLPSLRGGLGAVIQGTLHTETEEPVVDELSVVRAPYSMVTSEGTSSDVNTSSSEVNARSSELLDLSSSTTPLQSLLGITSADELQLEDGGLEDTNPGFFDEALAAPDYCGL